MRLECLQRSPEVFGTTYEDEVGKPKLYFEEQIERDTPDLFFFGAFANDDLIAIAGFVRGDRRKTRHSGEIVAMYVNPDFRGHGIGENLLRALVKTVFETEGVEQVFLTVIDSNATAVGLYERLGFEKFGVQKNYFKLGETYWNRQLMQLMKESFLKNNAEDLDES